MLGLPENPKKQTLGTWKTQTSKRLVPEKPKPANAWYLKNPNQQTLGNMKNSNQQTHGNTWTAKTYYSLHKSPLPNLSEILIGSMNESTLDVTQMKATCGMYTKSAVPKTHPKIPAYQKI